MSTTTTSTPVADSATADPWSRFFDRLVPALAIAGPALALVGALFVTFQAQMLPGDLDWISEPESLFVYLGAMVFPATWIVIGRCIAWSAPRTGIVVTVLGALGAFTAVSAATWRHMSIDLVDRGADATIVYEAWENPSLFSALATVATLPAFFLTPIIAAIAILKTKVAPVWAGIALLCFAPMFMAAQGAYAAIRVTYPLAWALMLVAIVGVMRAERTPRVGA